MAHEPEEAALLIANVLEELAGRELRIATDAASSKLLEQVCVGLCAGCAGGVGRCARPPSAVTTPPTIVPVLTLLLLLPGPLLLLLSHTSCWLVRPHLS